MGKKQTGGLYWYVEGAIAWMLVTWMDLVR
jgi:hypothetical protein